MTSALRSLAAHFTHASSPVKSYLPAFGSITFHGVASAMTSNCFAAAVLAAVANRDAATHELKEAEEQLARLTAELGQAEAASSPAMEQDVAEAAPKRCRQGDSVEAQSAEPDRSAAAPVAEPTVLVADVQVLIAQAVEAAMATAMQVQIQKVMDHFECQVIALPSSLTEGFEARLAEAVAGIQLSAAMARRTARAEPYKAPG